MNRPSSRVCTETGLALTAGPVSALRVARESYGPLNPPPRSSNTDVSGWSRYDTTGRTIYACADAVTAFMELIAPYRTDVNRERRALHPLADALGIDLDSFWEQVVDEWDAAGTMKASWLPRSFRDGRNLYTLEFPAGWWIDATAMDTIAALNRISQAWPSSNGPVENLTVSHLTGDDRVLTTSIASYGKMLSSTTARFRSASSFCPNTAAPTEAPAPAGHTGVVIPTVGSTS